MTSAFGDTPRQLDVIDLQLRWHHQFQFAGYYAAVEKGYYKEEGLEVRLHAGDPSHQPVPEVLSGHAQYAESNSEILYQRLQGKPLVALAAIFQHSPSVLLTRKDSGIDSPHDLIGKKVMLQSATKDADFMSMLISEGVSPAKVNIMSSSYNLDDLISGKVDAFNSYTTNEPYFLKQRNIPYYIIDPRNYGVDFYSDILFTSETELREHPHRVEALRRATLKGWRYAMDHQDEIIDLLIDKYHVNKTRAHLAFEAAEMRRLIFPDLIEIGHMNPGRWQRMAETFVKAGLVRSGYSLDGFIYDPAPTRLPTWPLPALLAVSSILAIVLYATYYLYRLNRRYASTQKNLNKSQQMLFEAQQITHLGSWDWNLTDGSLLWSDEAHEIYMPDDKAAEPSYEAFAKSIHPDDRDRVIASVKSALEQDTSYDIEHRVCSTSKGERYVHAQGKVFRDPAGKAVRMVGTVHDITEHKKAMESMQLASMVYQNSTEAMMVTNADGTIIDVNPAFTQVTGYSAAEVIGENPRILKSGRQNEAFYQNMWQSLISIGKWEGEIWNRRKNGEIYPERLTINTIFNKDGSVHRYVALFSDITKQKESEERIWQQANFDDLTELPNRRMFYDRLEQEIRKAHRSGFPLALMFLDLDHFKEVNDILGHDMGDVLLKDAAQRITGCVRGSDTVARLGGDEFVIIMSELHEPGSVDRVAAEVLKKLAEPFRLGNEITYISGSIGITMFPEDATSSEALLKNADQAMFAAKKLGRNNYHYYTTFMQEAAMVRARISKDLRGALSGNQFRAYFQPIVELSTGHILKAEALIRWQHPTLGLVSPASFIPIAEETGLIIPIGDWIFKEAARMAMQWRKRIPTFQVSVNKSPAQFRDTPDHVDWFNYLQQNSFAGKSVVVEITEGLLADSSINDKLLTFRGTGIQVSLDDFGTGYSSLSYLKKFDIDYLKIDQSFVKSLTPDSSDMALCEAIIVMAHKLDIKVIAEGIETEEQRDLLLAAGCDYGQGYLFSHPVSGEEFERLLDEVQT